jgi:hypothetical protein
MFILLIKNSALCSHYLLGKGNNWIILFVVILIIDIILAALLGGAGTYIAGLIGIIFALDAYCGWINI